MSSVSLWSMPASLDLKRYSGRLRSSRPRGPICPSVRLTRASHPCCLSRLDSAALYTSKFMAPSSWRAAGISHGGIGATNTGTPQPAHYTDAFDGWLHCLHSPWISFWVHRGPPKMQDVASHVPPKKGHSLGMKVQT